jgi:dTDP-4-amino-4,6-dideoxygalactose transaminase
MYVPFVDLKLQYQNIQSQIDKGIQSVINETAFISGKYATAFEEAFAQYLGVNHVIACANGTDSLEILLKAYQIGAGDEVIVPANSWISTSECVTTVGAKLVFVDSHPTLYTIDVTKIEEKITPRTKAIIPVHLYGCPADMDTIMQMANKHNLIVIEDCAQAHGASYRGKTIGTIGHASSFSFYPGKNLGAYGDAGGMATNDEAIATKARMIANHGRLGKHDHGVEGRNSRMDGIQAAILTAKLPYLEQWTQARMQHAQRYLSNLQHAGIQLPVIPDGIRHVFHLFVVQVPHREKVQQQLKEQGIDTGIHYPIALPLLKAYAYMEHQPNDFPVAAGQMDKLLSLPMYAELTQNQIDFVSEKLMEVLARH